MFDVHLSNERLQNNLALMGQYACLAADRPVGLIPIGGNAISGGISAWC
jgi:hypothetical protein